VVGARLDARGRGGLFVGGEAGGWVGGCECSLMCIVRFAACQSCELRGEAHWVAMLAGKCRSDALLAATWRSTAGGWSVYNSRTV
jgi:hypothetical protein